MWPYVSAAQPLPTITLQPNKKLGIDLTLYPNKKWVHPMPKNIVRSNPSLLNPEPNIHLGSVWLVVWGVMIPLLELFGSESGRGGMIPLGYIPSRFRMTLPPRKSA